MDPSKLRTDAARPDHVWQSELYDFNAKEADEEAQKAGDDEVRKVDAMFGQTHLGQEFFDTGLLFLVNSAVLHPWGWAISAQVQEMVDEDGHKYLVVVGLGLHKTSDPEGLWFDEATMIQGRRKLIGSGILRR